MFGIDKH